MSEDANSTNRSARESPSSARCDPVRRRTRLTNAALLIGTLVIAFAVAEIALRFVYHPENLESIIRFDETLGWALKPDVRLRSADNQTGLDYRIRTNSMGMRDRNISKEKKSGTKRILIIGDSIAYGTGVDAERRFSDFLSRALGNDVEVVNAGVCGWGTDQELLYYETSGRGLGPDLVILTFTMANDVLNNGLDHLFLGSAAKPRFVFRDGALSLEKAKLEAPSPRAGHRIRNALRNSRVLLFVKRRIDAVRYQKRVKEECAKGHEGFDKEDLERGYSHWSVYESSYGPEFERAWNVTEAVLQRFSKRCAEDGAGFLVFAFPLKLEVDGVWRRDLFAHVGIDSTRLDFNRPYEHLAAFCRTQGIDLVYPIETFRDASQTRKLYFSGDSHPNAYGNAVAAGVLLEVLRDRFFMDFKIADSDRPYLQPALEDPRTGTDHRVRSGL